jgi:hypothetical protein
MARATGRVEIALTSFPVFGAGWSSPVARQAHNLKVEGSNPSPATKQKARHVNALAGFIIWKFPEFRPEIPISGNAIKINAFSFCVIACWRVHVTCMAHENRHSVRRTFLGRCGR